MWQMASLLNFLHVFRPLLNIAVEFSAEELETALITPNNTLDDVHIPLLKAIPPVTRMALGRATWVTVLCRKLRDWWHWVAEGDIPIVASHGAEVETYKTLEPATRVLILKALCDIRVEQEDIRSYIEKSLKHGIHLSVFRRERIGGDSHGISYWYEDDPIIGHRLYREIRHVEVKKAKARGPTPLPHVSYQWETVATNLDEFEEVSDKLISSKNRTEAALGKRLKIDLLPEIEQIHKKKERLLKKQQRQALLLDNFVTTDGLSTGRSLRDRKPVTYTFDDYDRSISEAIKITKKKPDSPEHVIKKEGGAKPETSTEGDGKPDPSIEGGGKPEPSTNGRLNGTSKAMKQVSYESQSSKSTDYEESDGELQSDTLDRSNRRRKRPQRYSEKDYVEAVSDNEADFDSDDDIVGEAVYDDEYLKIKKQKKVSSSSEGDEEYRWEENDDEDEEGEEEEEDSLSISDEDSDDNHRYKKRPTRSRRAAKKRSVDEVKSGLRRSKRATKPRFNYRQYELSETDAESEKAEQSNASDAISDASNDMELSTASQDSEDHEENGEEMLKDEKMNVDSPNEDVEKEEGQSVEKADESPVQGEGGKRRRFLDLNELAPGTGFEDGPNSMTKDEDTDNP
ncbi:uncharacterized protein A4U43_C03F27870 [Asparagus officinalis]|uniref:DDT domain-containing protein n=1 Tax=Asparagus officinalis TaxID=4686 RepID=A0A5P1FDG1_ASPOF|nr:uncharacterized protein A4U43_C03F27870 [Asparagus officinalis]